MRYLIPVLLLLFVETLFAQTAESIATGRPGQAIGARTIGHGLFQIQSGYDYDSDKINQSQLETRTLNNVMRLGFGERFEVSTVVDYSFVKNTQGAVESNLEGLSQWQMGFRYTIIPEDPPGWVPRLALQTRFRMKQTSHNFKRNQVAPVMLLAAQNSLCDSLMLTLNGGISYSGNDNIPTHSYVISFSQTITDNISFAYEAYGNENNDQEANYGGLGIGYLINKDLQLDAYASAGKNQGMDEFYASVGFLGELGSFKYLESLIFFTSCLWL